MMKTSPFVPDELPIHAFDVASIALRGQTTAAVLRIAHERVSRWFSAEISGNPIFNSERHITVADVEFLPLSDPDHTESGKWLRVRVLTNIHEPQLLARLSIKLNVVLIESTMDVKQCVWWGWTQKWVEVGQWIDFTLGLEGERNQPLLGKHEVRKENV